MGKNGKERVTEVWLFLWSSDDWPPWTRWLTSFELYADGKGLIISNETTAATKQRRRAILLHLAGPDVQEIFTTLTETGDATNYASAVEALNAYFVPQVNSAFARQTFHRITQNPGGTVQQFVTRLRKAAKDCDFSTDTDNQIRDPVLNKCTSTYIKRKFLEEGQGLNLTRTLEVAAKCEKIEIQLAEVLHTMNGSKVFSKLDLKWGYHAPVGIEPRIQGNHNLCYTWWFVSIQELALWCLFCQWTISAWNCFSPAGIEGVENISGDIVVHGPDTEKQNRRLHQTIQRLQECGLTLNAEKCLFNTDRLLFMAMLLSQKGIGPTADLVKAVLEEEEP